MSNFSDKELSNYQNHPDLLELLSPEDIDSIFKNMDKNKFPHLYKIIKEQINRLSIYDIEFFTYHIRDYNLEQLNELKKRINPHKFSSHFKLIIDRIRKINPDYVYNAVENLYLSDNSIIKEDSEIPKESLDKNPFEIKKAVWLTVVVILFLQLFIFFKVQLTENSLNDYSIEYSYTITLMEIVFYSLVLYLLSKFIIDFTNISFADLGWKLDKAFYNILMGITTFFPFGLLIAFTKLNSLETKLDLDWEIGEPISVMLTLIITVIIAPIVEEIYFRGYLLKAIRTRINEKYFAYVINSIIFTFAHLSFFSFESFRFKPFIFILAFIACYLYEKTDSLVAPITFHVLNNALVCTIELVILLG